MEKLESESNVAFIALCSSHRNKAERDNLKRMRGTLPRTSRMKSLITRTFWPLFNKTPIRLRHYQYEWILMNEFICIIASILIRLLHKLPFITNTEFLVCPLCHQHPPADVNPLLRDTYLLRDICLLRDARPLRSSQSWHQRYPGFHRRRRCRRNADDS